MLPFKSYTAVYRYYLSEDNFLYKNYNSTPLYYKWMKGVDKEKMSTTLLVQAYPALSNNKISKQTTPPNL